MTQVPVIMIISVTKFNGCNVMASVDNNYDYDWKARMQLFLELHTFSQEYCSYSQSEQTKCYLEI